MEAKSSRILELAAAIIKNTKVIDAQLTRHELDQPSFLPNAQSHIGISPEAEKARFCILESTQKLHDLMQSPRDLVYENQHNKLVYIDFICEFDIARKVPDDGSISYDQLAEECNVKPSVMARILRHAIAYRVFREPEPGKIAHSAASILLKKDQSLRDWAGAKVQDLWPSAVKVVAAIKKWPEIVEPNQTGFALAHDTNESMFAFMETHPERARRFGSAMTFFTSGPEFSMSHLADGYPWAELGHGTVVDLGGSHGDAAMVIGRKFPELSIISQDLPQVIAGSPHAEISNVQLAAHDFFEPQPVKDADVYIFRWILHNWPDAYCIKLLQALIPALKEGAKVVVMDMVMPPVGMVPNGVERKIRGLDMTMLEIGNSAERDFGEWKRLFANADSRFAFQRILRPEGSRLPLLEWSWVT